MWILIKNDNADADADADAEDNGNDIDLWFIRRDIFFFHDNNRLLGQPILEEREYCSCPFSIHQLD